MAMVDLEREIMHLVDEKSAEAQGLMVFHLSTLYRRAYILFSHHDMTSAHSEWPNLRQVGHGFSLAGFESASQLACAGPDMPLIRYQLHVAMHVVHAL